MNKLCLFVLLSGIGLGGAAFSHPHVFVDAQAGFHFDKDGRLVSLRVTWTYDAFTSLTLFEILDLDKDGDGKLDDGDRAAIVAGETEWPDGYDGDIYLEAAGSGIPLARPVNQTNRFCQNWFVVDESLQIICHVLSIEISVVRILL